MSFTALDTTEVSLISQYSPKLQGPLFNNSGTNNKYVVNNLGMM